MALTSGLGGLPDGCRICVSLNNNRLLNWGMAAVALRQHVKLQTGQRNPCKGFPRPNISRLFSSVTWWCRACLPAGSWAAWRPVLCSLLSGNIVPLASSSKRHFVVVCEFPDVTKARQIQVFSSSILVVKLRHQRKKGLGQRKQENGLLSSNGKYLLLNASGKHFLSPPKCSVFSKR